MADGTVRIVSADSFTGQDEQRSKFGAMSVPVPQAAPSRSTARASRSTEVELHGVPDGLPPDARACR